MFKYLPLLLCLLMLRSSAQAQYDQEYDDEVVASEAEYTVSPPTGAIELRQFDASRIDELRSEYDHDRDIRRQPSYWERFKQWLRDWLSRLLGTYVGGMIVESLFYIVIVVAVVFALVMLSRASLQRVFHGAPRSIGEVAVSEDDIREMDLDEMIQEAERAGDLRRAIRLHYLLVLRKLVDQGILAWHPHNTDQDYMAQITDPLLRSRFAHVALVFQWVWYGNAEVAPAKYEDLRRPFIEFETSKAA